MKTAYTIAAVSALLALVLYGKYEQDARAQAAIAALQQEMATVDQQLLSIAKNTSVPYRMPMDKTPLLQDYAVFSVGFPDHFHTAIDWRVPHGTPVYAIADGIIRYADVKPDYAGLMIIDHPQDNLYSLYGHLSAPLGLKPVGPVKKGELLGYIASTKEGYLIGLYAHLHFSLRLGQWGDYPDTGEARWMAGYVEKHPIYHKWIDPEAFIQLTQQLPAAINPAINQETRAKP
ncbi:membrane protein [Photobacterium aphoticum]|uniref:Membrane protein n=1 Tax=Photobacterium aphoticum TaxID=754436 RepID=A0A090R8V5_9GAMM|nr:membrane protein [Photobacterium aphoticum]